MIVNSDVTCADKVTGFSSRGWNRAIPSIIKPDIVAPGASIIAPVIDGVGYAIYQGTSMASPHVAGAFALLKALHPDWSPAQAQAAIMTTAVATITIDDEGTNATPFDAGAGRINIGQAAQAALVLDENRASYENGDPALYWQTETTGVGITADLNLASLGNGSCVDQCSWRRTLQNMSDSTTSWQATVDSDSELELSVSPTSFNLSPEESIELTIEANTTAVPLEDWDFGRIVLTEVDGDAPDATIPVAVRHMTAKLPPSLKVTTTEQVGSKQYFKLETTNINTLTTTTFGLKAANVIQEKLDSDPTPNNIHNNDGGIYLHSIKISDNAVALSIDLESSESPDLDLYVGKDGSFEPVALSINADASEAITVTFPEAGDWWIAVHNFASYRQGVLFTLRYAVITRNDPDVANLIATTEPLNSSPFNLKLDWNLPETAAGDYWYGILQLGSSPATADDIGIIPVKLVIE
ncbi:MAG: hypothetical protein B6I37_09285 [Desulfobacteraceae bacterium 4572_35.2]|nr:MAG: hypothetical protein B6I37_09285 [Desulfobacteraceae bacterium 4572_35.2]